MPPTSPDALVLVDKPAGVTSFDVVRAVSRAIGTRRAGHAGTLDPFATGLLVILTGSGTRLMRFVPGDPKVYLATVRFGAETDTDDLDGRVTREAPVPDRASVLSELPALTGEIVQVPPSYSAKKVNGQRAYAMARAGDPAVLAPVTVRVHRWEVLQHGGDSLVARITCDGGTYIRALARDLGRATGSAAHLVALRREACGPFVVSMATSWDDLRAGHAHPRSVHEALGDMARESLTPDEVARVRHGQAVPARVAAARAALVDGAGNLLGVARREQEYWQPDVVLAHD